MRLLFCHEIDHSHCDLSSAFPRDKDSKTGSVHAKSPGVPEHGRRFPFLAGEKESGQEQRRTDYQVSIEALLTFEPAEEFSKHEQCSHLKSSECMDWPFDIDNRGDSFTEPARPGACPSQARPRQRQWPRS
jgi:hypothetical protein